MIRANKHRQFRLGTSGQTIAPGASAKKIHPPPDRELPALENFGARQKLPGGRRQKMPFRLAAPPFCTRAPPPSSQQKHGADKKCRALAGKTVPQPSKTLPLTAAGLKLLAPRGC
jgi:hypothetical protein